MALFPLFGAAYFLSIYVLLRLLTRSAVWSWVGLLACLQWQLYCGTDLPLWSAPSSSVLRSPCDLALATALLFRPAFPRESMIIAGVLGGISLLFGTDTGIYLAAALAIYSVLSSIRPVSGRRQSGLAWLWGAYFTVAIGGFLVASRGDLLERRFWTGYFESLLEYGGGLGALPVADVLMQPAFALLMLAILLVYTFMFSRSAAAVLRGTANDRDLVLAFTSVVGFGTFALFINRSHPYNLFHPIVPACVLTTVLIAERFSDFCNAATLRQ